VLAWYRANGRDLPWRQTRDPYKVLVSEVMLQQTQVDRVLPKYHEWLGRYPDFESLAAADESDVVRTWYPLGYNIRPKRLQAIARESVDRFDGSLPDDEETLRSFKGIGAYTAGAVMSFAFGKRAAILDTNVARVLFRTFVGRGDARSHAMDKHLWDVSRAVLHVCEVRPEPIGNGSLAPEHPGQDVARGRNETGDSKQLFPEPEQIGRRSLGACQDRAFDAFHAIPNAVLDREMAIDEAVEERVRQARHPVLLP